MGNSQLTSGNGHDLNTSLQLAQKKNQAKKKIDLRTSQAIDADSERLALSSSRGGNYGPLSLEHLTGLDRETLISALQELGVSFTDDTMPVDDVIPVDSVIRIFTTIQEPDWTMPWQTLNIAEARGSGVIIEEGILTAAHVIDLNTFIEVQLPGDAKRHITKVLHVCHDADLAILALPSAYKKIKSVPIGPMPKHRDHILVCGYPIGGEELSTTEGVVSRIEVQPYSHSLRTLLAVTVDAAINSGNSGGPVFDASGNVAGIAFQALEGAENVGHIIPPPVIRHFLTGIQKFGEKYQGFPLLNVEGQTMLNPSLRAHFKMTESQTGVLITKLYEKSTGFAELKVNDIILSSNGYDIANDGTIQYSSHFRGDFQLSIQDNQIGDMVPMSILRDGQVMEVNVELQPILVPLTQHIPRPPYYMFAGLLFQPLTLELLRNLFQSDLMSQAPQELLSTVTQNPNAMPPLLTRVFRAEINYGYEGCAYTLVTHVNGNKVETIEELIAKVEAVTKKEMVVLTLSGGRVVVLPSPHSKLAKKTWEENKVSYAVSSDRFLL